MRIRVLTETPLHHLKAGFQAWGPGEYDFPDDPAFAQWLEGQLDAGVIRKVEAEPEPAARAAQAEAEPPAKEPEPPARLEQPGPAPAEEKPPAPRPAPPTIPAREKPLLKRPAGRERGSRR